jgi:hypothetical protein
MNRTSLLAVLSPLLPLAAPSLLPLPVLAQQPKAPAPIATAKLPVREVTCFKDGHAWVVRESPLPADANGVVVLDELPAPLLGTFWPFATNGARLVSARAGRETVANDVAAADFRDLARANAGKPCSVLANDKDRVEGRLVGVPSQAGGAPPGHGELLLVETVTGTRAIPLASVRELEIRDGFTARVRRDEQKERLTLQVAAGGDGATVGVMYVQRGLRWIPAYKLDLDGKGNAAVQFEATLVNDLVDLERATVHLVIGVPKFAFEGMVDPISLQQEMVQVASHVRDQISMRRDFLSNSIMTQTANYRADPRGGGQDGQPAVEGSGAAEDLFVFTVRDVTLKQGERLVLPVSSFTLAYRDVYRLDVPFAPPMEVRQNLQSERVVELARLLQAPKARHVLRLVNGNDAPLTTAPALVLAGGRVLAQGHMLYTPKRVESDLEINVAVDVCVDTEEHETKRDPGPIRLGGENYGRVGVAGTITLRNEKTVPVEVEVSRRALGIADEVGQDGTKKQLDLVQAWHGGAQPGWWGWWSWPYWWFQHNGFAEFRWTVQLAPGASTQLDASWHYFWR